jgi:hypothetical protein
MASTSGKRAYLTIEVDTAQDLPELRDRLEALLAHFGTLPGEWIPTFYVGFTEERDRQRARNERAWEALHSIRALWTHPRPAQRQDVAYQEAVRLASEALS